MELCNIVGGILHYLKKLLMTPHLDSYSTTDVTPEKLSAVETGNRIQGDEKNVHGIANFIAN